MKVDIKDLPDSKKEITVELNAEDLRCYAQKAARDLSGKHKIEGFRDGNAPLKIVEQKLGEKVILERTIDIAVKESYVKVLIENKIETIAEPKIEVVKMVPKELLIFKAEVVVLPEIKLGDYSKLKLSHSKIKVEEKEIDKAIETLRKSRAAYKTVLRPAEKENRVEIDFESKANGKTIDGGISKQHPLIIGEEHFMKGFEDELIGMKEREEKKFSLVAPKDYYQKDLAGQKIEFTVKMNLVQEVEMPEINDAFAARLGKFTSLKDLKKSIEEGLLDEKKNKEKEKNRLEIIDLLIKSSSFKAPEKLVELELVKMEQEFSASLAQMNLEKDSYLAHIKKSMEDIKKQWQEQAEKRVGASLILREIAQKEAITISNEEVEERASQILKNAPDMEQIKNIDPNQLKEHVRAVMKNEKVFELLEKNIIS